MNILVVEDDFISRKLLCRYLEPYGTCDVAINGNEAVSAVRHANSEGRRYDLICLDIMMPGMSGHEALKHIRDIEAEYSVPAEEAVKVIMTTALEDPSNMQEAFDASADGYVVKPIEKRNFITTLAEIGLQVAAPC